MSEDAIEIDDSDEPFTQCAVLRCQNPGEAAFTKRFDEAIHFSQWWVCREHHDRPAAGEEWASDEEPPPGHQRWILMGDDLALRHDARLVGSSWRSTSAHHGTDVWLMLATAQEEHQYLLDAKAVRDLVQLVDLLQADTATRRTDTVTSSRGRRACHGP